MEPVIASGLVVTLAGLAVTLGAIRAERHSLLYVAKPTASVGFLIVALGSGGLDSSYGRWILVGLTLSLVGDVFLMFSGRPQFQSGLVAFLLAHLAYVVAFAVSWVSVAWALAAGVVAVIAAILVTRWLLPHVDPEMRVPVLAYVVVISAMVSLAIGAGGAGQTLLIPVGAGLFYVSDLFVARDRFVAPSFLNTLYGLPLYYLGQVFLALSVAG